MKQPDARELNCLKICYACNGSVKSLDDILRCDACKWAVKPNVDTYHISPIWVYPNDVQQAKCDYMELFKKAAAQPKGAVRTEWKSRT